MEYYCKVVLKYQFFSEIVFWLYFVQTVTLEQEPYENIVQMKSTCRSFLKVLDDCKLFYAYSMLNFESALFKLLKLLKSIFFKRKTKFAFLHILTKFSTQIPIIKIWELNPYNLI